MAIFVLKPLVEYINICIVITLDKKIQCCERSTKKEINLTYRKHRVSSGGETKLAKA